MRNYLHHPHACTACPQNRTAISCLTYTNPTRGDCIHGVHHLFTIKENIFVFLMCDLLFDHIFLFGRGPNRAMEMACFDTNVQ